MKNYILVLLTYFIFINSGTAQKIIVAKDFGAFNDGLAPILLDNRWGFIDTDGTVIIEPKFICYVSEYGSKPKFNEGFTPIVDPETERIGFINKKGELVINRQYYSAQNYHEGVAIVGTQDDHIIIDTTGKVLARKFVAINGYYSHFSHSRAIAQKEFKYGFINKNGIFVIEPKYDEVRVFSDNLAAVKLDGKWGFIDTNGVTKIPHKFTNEPLSFNSDRAFVQSTNNKWGIIDKTGILIQEPIYNQVFPYNNGFAVVSIMDEKWNNTFSIIDVNGKFVKSYPKTSNSAETIIFVSGFNEGLAIAMKSGKYGMIDTKTKVAVNFLYLILKPMSSGRAYFERYDEKTRKNVQGFLDNTGKEIIILQEPEF